MRAGFLFWLFMRKRNASEFAAMEKQFATAGSFWPVLVLHHKNPVPHPILPINYSYFVVVRLPEQFSRLTLSQQLKVAQQSLQVRLRYPFVGPFGPIIACELRCTEKMSVYLNKKGDFSARSYAT